MPDEQISEFIALRSTVNLFSAYSYLIELAENYGLRASYDAEVIYSRDLETQPSLRSLLAKYRDLANIDRANEYFLEYPAVSVATEPYTSIAAAMAEAEQIHPGIKPTNYMGKLVGPLKHYYNASYPESGTVPSMPTEVSQMIADINYLCDRLKNGSEKMCLDDCAIEYKFDTNTLNVNELKIKFTGKYGPKILTEIFSRDHGTVFSCEAMAEVLGLRADTEGAPQDIYHSIRDSVRKINSRVMELVPTDDKLILVENGEFYTLYAQESEE